MKLKSTHPRLQTVLRLFRMILDITSPDFTVEDRQWKPSVIDIFFYFFSALWADDRVRKENESISVPTHPPSR